MPQAAQPAYNATRFWAYKRAAEEFLTGDMYDAHQLAQMLHDLQWPEVSRAFSFAIYKAATKGTLRPDLQAEFANLVAYVAFLAFGSTERRVAQPWFLKNWDSFFVSCINGLVNLHDYRHAGDDDARRERTLRRAFEGVLALAGGAKRYMSLDRVARSSAVHALLVAAGHGERSFLWNGFVSSGGRSEAVPPRFRVEAQRPMTMAHVVLMDVIADAVLATDDHDVTTWERAFGHYAGAARWRAFSDRGARFCAGRGSTTMHSALHLEHCVKQAFASAISAAEAAAVSGATLEGTARAGRKRKRATEGAATVETATARSLVEWEEQAAADAMAVAVADAPLNPAHAWLSPPRPPRAPPPPLSARALARAPRTPHNLARASHSETGKGRL